MTPQQDPFAAIAEPPQQTQTDPFAAIAEKPDAPKPSMWQSMKNNFNANTQGAKPGDGAIKSAVEDIGAGGGDVVRAVAHPLRTLQSTLKHSPDPAAGFAFRNAPDAPEQPKANIARQIGRAGTGAILGGAAGEALGAGGNAVKAVGEKVAPVLTRTSDQMMARLVGANRRGALGTKATYKQAMDIGKVVNDAVDGGMTLRDIAGKINEAKSDLTAHTQTMIEKVPEHVTVEVQPLFSKNAMKSVEGTLNEPSHKAIMNLMTELETQYPKQITAREAFNLRQDLLRETDLGGVRKWPAGTRTYRTALYHDLNNQLEKVLPPNEAAEFRANNYKVSNLIKADKALDRKRLYGVGDLGKVHSTVGAAARVATGGTPGRMMMLKTLKKAGEVLTPEQ